MNPIIQKAQSVLSMHGDTFHAEFLSSDSEVNIHSKNVSEILTDEEFNILLYFTAIGSGTVYCLAKDISSQELMDFLCYFDSILKKIPIETQSLVYRMDTYEKYVDKFEYISRYKKLMSDGIYIKIPWSLSVSIENWNKDCPDNPIWEIELLGEDTNAHSIYPLMERDKILHDQEMEVRFEADTILQIVSVSEQEGYPYIKMKECPLQEISNITKVVTLK